MSGIDLTAAIEGLHQAKEWLDARGLFETPERLAHLVGQCAHESRLFEATVESLAYRTAARIRAVFGTRRFPTVADAEPFVRAEISLGNKVYGGRMGNKAPDDGWRYRGRGYLHLTGRDNYRAFGRALGLALEAEPDLAREPAIAWRVAGEYLATRKRARLSALQWADRGSVAQVTRIVNGGTHGLDERKRLTALALEALTRRETP